MSPSCNFCMYEFCFWESDENEVVVLTCVVHRDDEHNCMAFFLDLMTKYNEIDCGCDIDQPALYSLPCGFTEDLFIGSRKYITLNKKSYRFHCKHIKSGLKATFGTK